MFIIEYILKLLIEIDIDATTTSPELDTTMTFPGFVSTIVAPDTDATMKATPNMTTTTESILSSIHSTEIANGALVQIFTNS